MEVHEDEDDSTDEETTRDIESTDSDDSSNESLEVEAITDDFLFSVEDIV